VLPESSYPPILQGAVLTAAGESRQKAEAFLRFLLSPRVQQRLAQWGYLPVEAAVS
jgi:ABC-type molybdate transport system substrate-binding protein